MVAVGPDVPAQHGINNSTRNGSLHLKGVSKLGMPVTPLLRKLRQEDGHKRNACLGYTVSSRQALSYSK